MNATKPDQSDILAQNAQLSADLATAKQTIGSLQTQVREADLRLSALTTERDTHAADKMKLTTDLAAANLERDQLKTENQTLKAEKLTLDKAVATKLAALGITEKALETPKLDPNRKLSPTEACRAVKDGAALDSVMPFLNRN